MVANPNSMAGNVLQGKEEEWLGRYFFNRMDRKGRMQGGMD